MMTRVLEKCADNGRARFVCLRQNSECLLRFRHLVHVWIKLPVTTRGALINDGRKPYIDRWVSAANDMRPALFELASRKKDLRLEAHEIASLPEARKDLGPFADWLREDQQVQKRVADAWNSLAHENQDLSVPPVFSVQLANDTVQKWAMTWL